MTTVNDQALNSLADILRLETEHADIISQKLLRGAGEKQRRRNRLHEERRYKNFVSLFVAYVRFARELTDLISIFDHSELAVQTLTAVYSRLSHLFVTEVVLLPADLIASWDSSCLAIQAPKQDSNLPLPLSVVAPSRREIWLKRLEQLKTLQISMIIRRHALMDDQFIGMDMNDDEISELERSESELSHVFDEDGACLLIQTFERVRQALLRRLYLKDVRQKALDLDKKTSDIDINRAAVVIQSRTRGYLTRKRVKEQRQQELKLLGMQLETVLRLQPNEQSIKISSPVAKESEDKTKSSMIVEILSALHAELSSEQRKTMKNDNQRVLAGSPGADKNERLAGMSFEELVHLGVIQKQPSDPNLINLLVSYPVETIWNTSKGAKIIDLRNALLCTTVVPQALSTTSGDCGTTKSILLIGRSKSGKSAWSQAIAASCAATYIHVTPKLVKKQPTLRNKICYIITKVSDGNYKLWITQRCAQFARDDKYVVIAFDRLEMFAASEEKKRKRFKVAMLNAFRKLFTSIVELKESSSVILLGMSRKNEELESPFNLFDIRMILKVPETPERFELIVGRLRTRLGQNKLPVIPKRVLELSKATRKAPSCGEILEKVDAKISNA
uniref:ATPase AAA-type core domain-containing protein n=1 Tax=Plectus sambesii TaxID=2011161 RepID=A0A914V419_9BILA